MDTDKIEIMVKTTQEVIEGAGASLDRGNVEYSTARSSIAIAESLVAITIILNSIDDSLYQIRQAVGLSVA